MSIGGKTLIIIISTEQTVYHLIVFMIFFKTVKVLCGLQLAKGYVVMMVMFLKLIHQIAKPQNQAHALGKIVLEEFGIAILMVIYTMLKMVN